MTPNPRLASNLLILLSALFFPFMQGSVLASSQTITEVPSILAQQEKIRAELYTKISPTVVGLTCNAKMPNGRKSGFYGTGVVISQDGLILTNTSVIPKESTDIKTYFTDGHVREGEIIQIDDASEGVLLRVKAKQLAFMTLADSRQSKVGDSIYSWGNPRHTIMVDGAVSFSTGTISGLYKASSVDTLSRYLGPVIETDAAINGGSDGGPLTNKQGQLVGLVSLAVSTTRWLGLAVPVHVMAKTMPELKKIKLVTPKPSIDAAIDTSGSRDQSASLLAASPVTKATVSLVILREGQKEDPPQLRKDRILKARKPYPLDARTNSIRQKDIRQRPPSGMASGFIIESSGIVVTSAFHFSGSPKVKKIFVYLHDEKRMEAKLLGKDSTLDLAILAIQGTPLQKFPSVSIQKDASLFLGSTTIILGRSESPGDLTQNTGIVSGRSRFGNNFCQISGLINYGNLGGPVINLDGVVVGMASKLNEKTQWRQNCGVGFMLYSAKIREALPFLKKGETIKRPYFGIQADRKTTKIKGIKILKVMPKTAAAKAGLKKNDVITNLNGQAVETWDQFIVQIKKLKIGAALHLKILRSGKPLALKAQMGSKG